MVEYFAYNKKVNGSNPLLFRMKKFIQKDKNNRKIIQNFEKTRFILKNIIKNLYYLNVIRWLAVLNLNNLLKKSSMVFLINKCILTGSKTRINKFCNYSRIVFIKIFKYK